jgi:undecaprenyl diphosphate synthase
VIGHRAGARGAAHDRLLPRRGVQALTLFAFSSENWGRPEDEVNA